MTAWLLYRDVSAQTEILKTEFKSQNMNNIDDANRSLLPWEQNWMSKGTGVNRIKTASV